MRRNPTELTEIELVLFFVVLHLDLARLAVDGHDEVFADTEALAYARGQCFFQPTEDHFRGNVLLAVDDVDHPQEVFEVHGGSWWFGVVESFGSPISGGLTRSGGTIALIK